MGEKTGSLFLMIIGVIIAGILIAAFLVFYPEITGKITGGATKFVDEGLKRSTIQMITSLPFMK